MIQEVTIRMHPHPTQELVHNCPARFKWVSNGKRWGKTTLGCGEALDAASKGGRAWWIGPDYKRAREGWDPLSDLCRPFPGVKINQTEKDVYLPGGGVCQVRSSDNPESLRGSGLDLAVFDEAAFQPVRAWHIVRSQVMDRGGRALFITTPAGHNWFFDGHRKATQCPIRAQRIDHADGRVEILLEGSCEACPVFKGESDSAAFNFSTAMNPHLSAAELAAVRRDMPERVRLEEIEAQFLADGSGVFPNIDGCATSEAIDAAIPGHSYVIGADWGIFHDATVLTVVDVTERRQVHQRRITNGDTIMQENIAVAVHGAFGSCPFVAESNSIGAPMIQRLVARNVPVIPFVTTQASKDEAVRSLALAMELGQFRILNEEQLKHELRTFESRRGTNGLLHYSAPEGGHDDCVMALLIAHQASQIDTTGEIVAGGRSEWDTE